jgi:hypothetical protein
MTKGLVGDLKGFEVRKSREAEYVEYHKKHNHTLTMQARTARKEKHKLHTMEKRQNGGP